MSKHKTDEMLEVIIDFSIAPLVPYSIILLDCQLCILKQLLAKL